MIANRVIELLAPAKNADYGIEAIKHGADAVYIGAPRFSARSAAGNDISQIERLVQFARFYRVRVYVAINTILLDSELIEAEKIIHNLYKIGIDALIVQDMSILKMDLPPIALHASTQTDNRTPEKVSFLTKNGFRRVVLARELSLDAISEIHSKCPNTELEAFVHGSLCVSYSGQCYASQLCYKRSANRGECAQFCRLPFTLSDANGNIIVEDKHLLSLKDMIRGDYLEEMLDAGIISFKIEGRLKDISYVKNITGYYNNLLNSILERRKEYKRGSSGSIRLKFEPNPYKSFNRGFTDYLLNGKKDDIASFDTPKSIGEYMGIVTDSGPGWLEVSDGSRFSNGDGLCHFDSKGVLRGYRVNRVEGEKLSLYIDSTEVFDKSGFTIEPGTKIYRNFDHEFEKTLSKESAEREIDVRLELSQNSEGFRLDIVDSDGVEAYALLTYMKERAQSPQKKNIIKQLSRLGNTGFRAEEVIVNMEDEWFIPSSLLSSLRREAVKALIEARKNGYMALPANSRNNVTDYPESRIEYTGNVMNHKAKSFYRERGVSDIAMAFEIEPVDNAVVMYCEHCLKYAFGWCTKHKGAVSPYSEPYYLISPYGKRFKLLFDCDNCRMLVKASDDI